MVALIADAWTVFQLVAALIGAVAGLAIGQKLGPDHPDTLRTREWIKYWKSRAPQ